MPTSNAPSAARLPIVAVADLHGHVARFDALLAHWDRELGNDYRLILLGDYVDNGPQIPQLLDRLVALQRARGDRFTAIMGNHDLACLRSMGWDGGDPDERWFAHWRRNFCNPGFGTADAYGARSGADLAARMPAEHRRFLQELPFFAEVDDHVFVHAGLTTAASIDEQLRYLSTRPLLDRQFTIPQLRDRSLARASEPSWPRTVVSGHTKFPGRGETTAPHFVAERRITLSASVDEDGCLWSVLLPARRFVGVGRDGGLLRDPGVRGGAGG